MRSESRVAEGESVLIRMDRNWKDLRLLRPLRLLVRQLKRWAARLSHPGRRSRAMARIRNLGPVRRILIMCLGNICRSPYGAERLRAGSAQGHTFEIKSAGLMGPGRPSPEHARSAASALGLNLTHHVSQLVTRELVEWADLVLVMSAGQAKVLAREFGARPDRCLVLGDLDPETADRREIQDPEGRSLEVFFSSYQRIDRCVDTLLSALEAR